MLLTLVFVKKLPTEMRLAVSRKVPRKNWTMEKILGVQSGCCFCKGEDHGPVNYKRFITVEECKCIIKEQGRCFMCLRPGHVSRNCQSSAKCGNCNKRHHISVCIKSSITESPLI